MSKRGCSAEPTGPPVVHRAVFSQATPTVLLPDYQRAPESLRLERDVVASRIVLSGSSEGTRLAPRLALESPAGIQGLVLTGASADNWHDTVVWHNSVGAWRNIQKLIPAADDDTLTRSEYDRAVASDSTIARQLLFATIDPDGSGVTTREESVQVLKPRLDAISSAVVNGQDEVTWLAVANFTSAYLREEWEAAPTVENLPRLRVPVASFHGELDGATEVEGVREALDAFRRAGRNELTASIYPGYDHDLNWTPETAAAGGPKAFLDAVCRAALMLRSATRPPSAVR